MASGENLFSRTFRGFAPDEVIAYIDELNAAQRSAKAESDAKINALSEELDAMKKNGSENEELKASAAQKDETIAEKNAEIERLTADTENQKKAIEAQGDKIAELENIVAELKTELEAAHIKNSAMEKNSKEYEAMLADVDSILSSSRRKAEELVADAERKSAEIIENAKSEAKEKTAEIISASDERVNENMKKVKYLYRRQDELAEIFREHKAKVDSFFASIPDTAGKNERG